MAVSRGLIAIEPQETKGDNINLADDSEAYKLRRRIEELEFLVERLENKLIQFTGYVEDHAHALDAQRRDIEETKEYLGFVPQRVELWDGLEIQQVEHIGERQRYVGTRYIGGRRCIDRPKPTTMGVPMGHEGMSASASASGVLAASARWPGQVVRPPVSRPTYVAPQTGQALLAGTSSATETASASASAYQSLPAAQPGDGQDAPISSQAGFIIPEDVGGEEGRAGQPDPVTAPRAGNAPIVRLIPPTPQTSQEAAEYPQVGLLAEKSHPEPEARTTADAEHDADAERVPDTDKNTIGRGGDDTRNVEVDSVVRSGPIDAIAEIAEGELGLLETASVTRNDDTTSSGETSRNADAADSTSRPGDSDPASHLQPPPPQSPTHLASPRPRSRSRRSPVPPEELRRSPRLHSPSPGPQALSPGTLKRSLPEDSREGGSSKRAKQS